VNQQQNLDRSTLIGIILITLIMGVWLVMYQPPMPPPPQEVETLPDAEEEVVEPEVRTERERATPPDDEAFEAVRSGVERQITVQSENYTATFSTRGATLRSFQLTRYDRAGQEGVPVEMISDEEGAIALAFTPPQGRYVDTRTLYFQAPYLEDRLEVGEGGAELVFEAPIGDGVLRYVYTFAPESYQIGLRIEEGEGQLLTESGGFELIWDGGIPFAEADERDEAQSTAVHARSGGEIVTLSLSRRPQESLRLSGQVEWVAIKTKYFTSLVQPLGNTEGAEIEGVRRGEPGEEGFAETYAARILMPRPRGEPTEFSMYLGPMDLRQLDGVAPDVSRLIEYGFGAFITRPVAEFVVEPLFRFLGRFLPNYGLVIILFAMIIKLAVYPLTKISYKNTARMRELQPKLEAVKEKFADDPQKQQEAMLKVYRDTGINPLAGCLPLLLQYPIIIALWRYFQNSIIIRQEGFLWAHDLSAPDPILQLPFTIPFYGDFVAGFTLIMGLAMIVQMKVAMPPTTGGMQMKIFIYVLPLLLFVIFNRLASGLSLYYLVFNVLTIVQQKMINKQIEAEGALGEPQKAKPAKKPKAGGNGQLKRKGKAPRKPPVRAKR
jgi:YidC/Oxa1 family membrane protein insertase